MKQKTRRLEIHLPRDHPIFNVPPGQRSRKVREALDLAERLECALASLDARLARIEQALASGVVVQANKGPEQEEKQKYEIDVEAFMEL